MADPASWTPVFILLIFTTFANGFVFFVIIKSGLLHSRQNVMVFTLIICDTIRSLMKFVELAFLVRYHSDDNDVACKVFGFFTTWSDLIACCAVAMLFYDRLIFMSAPINYLHRMTRTLVLIIIIYANLHSLLLAVIPLTGWGSFAYYPSVVRCHTKLPEGVGYGAFRILFGHGIPILATTALFIRMAVIVHKKMKQIKVYNTMINTPQPMGLHRAISKGSITEMDKAFVKTLKILGLMLFFYYISWLSHISMHLYMIARKGEDLSIGVLVCWTLLSFTTCAANPFVYGLHNRRFQQTMTKIVTCGRVAESDIEDISTNPTRGIALISPNYYKVKGQGRYVKTDGDEGASNGSLGGGATNGMANAALDDIYLAVRPAWREREEEYRI